MRKPKVFLFDEPLSNLDAKLRVQMRAEISALHHRLQATMIYVTHDQVEAMTMGDRIVVMKDGLIQQIGTPLELYDHPVNRFVAGFIGTPPMNIMEATLREQGGRLVVDEGDFRVQLPGARGRHHAPLPGQGRAGRHPPRGHGGTGKAPGRARPSRPGSRWWSPWARKSCCTSAPAAQSIIVAFRRTTCSRSVTRRT